MSQFNSLLPKALKLWNAEKLALFKTLKVSGIIHAITQNLATVRNWLHWEKQKSRIINKTV